MEATHIGVKLKPSAFEQYRLLHTEHVWEWGNNKFFAFGVSIVRFGLLSGHLLGNSCLLGWPFVLIVFCLFLIFIYFPFWFKEWDLAFDCSSSCSLLFFYFCLAL